MNIFVLSLFSFFLFFLSFLKPTFCNEVLLRALERNMQELQSAVKSLQTAVREQNEVIKNQAVRIDGLEKAKGGGLQYAPAPDSRVPGLAGFSQGFNPDIGVVGIVQAKLTEETRDGEGNDTIALKELELNFGRYVDPFSRLDAVIALNDNLERQNVDIEEAYYSHWGLPLGFRGQIGKFRSKIGKQNLLHSELLDTADYPVVIRDFFGEEGQASSGVRLVHNIPNPLSIPLEMTGEVLRGNNGASFSGISRRPIFNTHAKAYFEFSKEANLELGWTTLFGDDNTTPQLSKGQDRYGVQVYGSDITFNRLLPQERAVKWQNEIYFQNRNDRAHVNADPWGFYSLFDYRFSRKFSAGVRFDYVEPLDVAGDHIRTTGISPYLTFWQSEFANFRLQFSHTEPAGAEAKADNAVFLKANVLIGVDKHPIQ